MLNLQTLLVLLRNGCCSTLYYVTLAGTMATVFHGCDFIEGNNYRGKPIERGLGKGDGTGSCEGHCGGQAPAGCWCDDQCEVYKDCCTDKKPVCDQQASSCEGSCGGQSPDGCYCDDLCERIGDCCDDKVAVCDQVVNNETCGVDADCAQGEYCQLPVGWCELDYGALDPSLLKTAGKCSPIKPDQACILLYDPVCGCNGATYGNACDAQSKGVNILHQGECVTTTCNFKQPGKTYVGHSPEKCAAMKFSCPSGNLFFDDCGCGCIEEPKPEFCGGIGGVKCPKGEICVLDGMYPDASGTCQKACKQDAECADGFCSYADGAGTAKACKPWSEVGEICGGLVPEYMLTKCRPGLICQAESQYLMDGPGYCAPSCQSDKECQSLPVPMTSCSQDDCSTYEWHCVAKQCQLITIPGQNTTKPLCFVGGCSKELCTSDPNVASDCLWKDDYACLQYAVCGLDASGSQCGWTYTQTYKDCIAKLAKN